MANNLAAFKAEVWSKRLLTKLNQTNVMLGLVNQDWEGDLRKGGDTVHVRTRGRVTMRAYTKYTPITYEDLAPTKEPMVVATSQYFAFNVDDIDRAQNDLSALDQYTQESVVAMNNAVEAKILAQVAKAHTSNRITGASNAAIALSAEGAGTSVWEQLVKAGELLDLNEVPSDGRFAVIDPPTYSLVLNDTKRFIRASDLGDQMVASAKLTGSTAKNTPGFVGQIAGFDVYKTTQVRTATGDGATHKLLPFGRSGAISYAGIIREMEALRLEGFFGNAVRGLLLHDAEVFAELSKQLGYIKATL